jgi:2-C-methyl-D-erythritol 4-phosphate cytidylyltransferase
MDHIDAIVVAAGAGTRLGSSLPKAFVHLAGVPMFFHCLRQFDSHKSISAIVLVVPSNMVQETQQILSGRKFEKRIIVVAGGTHRWQSVSNGVNASRSEWILVHDAARPFVTHPVIDAVLDKMAGYNAVITVTPEVDTIRKFSNDRALDTLNRATLVRVGTPQLFKSSVLKESFSSAASMDTPPTDEAMLMEAMGVPVGIAWGDPLNFKITTQSDLMIAEALCAYHK